MTHPGLLLRLLYLANESTFGRYGSLDHFTLAWIVFFEVPLYMGMAMVRGAQKSVGASFQHGA